MTYQLPINQCLLLAERRISDAAHATVRLRDAELARDIEARAREFLTVAAQQGWAGDANATIAAHWRTYLPQGYQFITLIKPNGEAATPREIALYRCK